MLEGSVFEDLVEEPAAERISAGLRAGALALDLFFMFVMTMAAGILHIVFGNFNAPALFDKCFLFICLLPPACFLPEVFSGQSFGKLILNLRVGCADGRLAALGRLLLRYTLKSTG